MDRVDEVIERAATRLRDLEPSTVAVIVAGSYAKGNADLDSDLDLVAVTESEPTVPYRTWFEHREDAKPLHVSAGIRSVARWLERARGEPQTWAFGFASQYEACYVWALPDAREKLGDPPTITNPPASPELEDYVEFLVKVRRAAAAGDVAPMRHYAYQAGLLVPALLQSLNGKIVVRDRADAVETALGLAVAPTHYRADLEVCLALVGAEDDEVLAAAIRLGRELLAFLREHKPEVDPQPDIARYLADGTLERHLGFLSS